MDWLTYRARTTPQKTALIFQQSRWTFAELDVWANQLAGRLAAGGVRPGQHVAALLPNRPETVAVIHALAKLGAVLVPINLRLAAEEAGWQVEQADCEWLLCTHQTAEQVMNYHKSAAMLYMENLPATGNWSPPTFEPSRPQGILFTSGTTGHPKGALLTFDNFFWSATASAFRLGVLPNDGWLLTMPLYHVGGLSIVMRSTLYGTAIILQDGFSEEAVWQALANQPVSLISLVPTMLRRLLAFANSAPWPKSLRCILLGGAAAPPDLLAEAQANRLPVAVTYGLTEACSQVATAPPEISRKKPGSAGSPLMFSRVQICGQHDTPLPAGETGQIWVQGRTVMQAYYRQPEASAQAIQNHWLNTGDLGYLDDDGHLWVVNRRNDLIISGGENVYPAEVENMLQSHPDVQQSCVVGLPDEEWGQRVAAMVIPVSGRQIQSANLLTYCRAKLADYKCPKVVHLTAEFPRTASGKIIREKVRQSIIEEINKQHE